MHLIRISKLIIVFAIIVIPKLGYSAGSLPESIVTNGLQGSKIALLTPHIQLFKSTLKNGPIPYKDETDNAQRLASQWIKQFFDDSNINLVEFTNPEEESKNRIDQLQTLTHRIGYNILDRAFISYNHVGFTARGKSGSGIKDLEWSIGEGARLIADQTGADYALVFHYHRGYLSGGSKLALLGAAVVIGGMAASSNSSYVYVGSRGNYLQAGFATLIDLKTGNLVWFSNTFNAYGDMRKEANVQHTVSMILRGMPGLVVSPKPAPKKQPGF